MNALKFCNTCNEPKPRSSFYRNVTKSDGFRDECKICYKEKNGENLRSRTAQRRLDHKRWLREEVLSKRSCTECGENHPATLDFHHRDPSTKVDEVSNMIGELINLEKVKLEIEKCDILCANCHRKRHWREFRGSS